MLMPTTSNQGYPLEKSLMDPLSVIASITGIATAGISLSRALYDAISTLRNAPKEVSQIARGLYELSSTFRELQRVLKDGRDVYRRKLIRRVASAIKRVGRVQREIQDLLDGSGALAKLRWVFRKAKTMELLYAIESHKTAISVILQTMMLAVQLKQLSRENDKALVANDPDDGEGVWNEAVFARQQAETTVQISYQPLRELTPEISSPDLQHVSGDKNNDSGHDKDPGSQSIQTRSPQSFDSAIWLYDLVFSATIEAMAEAPEFETDQASAHDSLSVQGSQESSGESEASVSSRALVSRRESSLAQVQSLAQQLPAPSTVVNELLSEWTTLTEAEIEGIDKTKQREKQQEKKPNHELSPDATYNEVQMVNFKDAVGRKFELPFHLIREWAGMEELIKHMFIHVDAIDPHIQAGHYDIINSKGNVVIPHLWKYTVNPTDSYTMLMWDPAMHPGQKKPPAGMPRLPLRPLQPGIGKDENDVPAPPLGRRVPPHKPPEFYDLSLPIINSPPRVVNGTLVGKEIGRKGRKDVEKVASRS
ncbi:hypothetical protein F5Y10DRAFT_284511 [Nemania abortiva]|nr:hypothetical protein F5Y10DRAFT_284511 [Nemania abortiva]